MASADAPAEAGGALLNIEVVYGSGPRTVDRLALQLPPGATLRDAIKASGLVERHCLHLDEAFSAGIWSKPKSLDTLLREADRVELYRGLQVDPKEARRQRYRKQTGGKPPKRT